MRSFFHHIQRAHLMIVSCAAGLFVCVTSRPGSRTNRAGRVLYARLRTRAIRRVVAVYGSYALGVRGARTRRERLSRSLVAPPSTLIFSYECVSSVRGRPF